MNVYRSQGAPYSNECLANPKIDCSNSVNFECPSCGLYQHDAYPYFSTAIFHVTQANYPKHQLVSIRRLSHFISEVARHAPHKR